jgi:DNA-binding response OmpR family regulator
MEKPFHFIELEARIRTLLRCDFSVIETVINHNNITLDTGLKKVFYQEKEISLTNKEYSILEYLFFKVHISNYEKRYQ